MKQSKAIVECKKAGTGELCDENCPLYNRCWLKEEGEKEEYEETAKSDI